MVDAYPRGLLRSFSENSDLQCLTEVFKPLNFFFNFEMMLPYIKILYSFFPHQSTFHLYIIITKQKKDSSVTNLLI